MTHVAVDVQEASGLYARLSPDGRRLAFLMLGTPFVADLATTRARAVIEPVETPTRYNTVAWSPDGRRLALIVDERPGSNEGLVVVDVATRRRTIVSSLFDLGDVVWNSDGSLLVTRPVGDSVELRGYPAVANATPSLLLRLPRGTGQLAIDSEGKRVAYTTAISPATGLPTQASEIAEVDLGARTRRTLIPAGTLDGYPSYAPDGRSLAFLSSREGAPQLWVAGRDGQSPRRLASGLDDVLLTPTSWTPDSKRIVLAARGRAWAISVDGGGSRELAFTATVRVARWSGLRTPEIPVPGSARRASMTNALLSPEGKSVVFSALGDLWLAPAAGGSPRRLTDTPARDELAAAWAPDSRRVVHSVLEPGRNPTWVIRDVAGSDPGTAVPIGGMPHAWSPDGRLIAFSEAPGPGRLPPRIGWMDVSTHAVQRIVPAGPVEAIWFSPQSDSLRYTAQTAASVDSVRGRYFPRRLLQAVLRDSAMSTTWNPLAAPVGILSAWSPDGSHVAWSRAGEGYWQSQTRNGPPVRIDDPTPRAFSWSADGRLLLYLSRARLRLLDLTTGRARTLDVAPGYTVAAPAPVIVIRNVRILDGRGRPPTEPYDVLIQEGRIAQIGRNLTTADGTREIEGQGRTLMPGLFDLHVHLFGGEPPTPLFLHYGVTTVRDLGARGEWARTQRERAEERRVPMPRIIMSAGQLTAEAGVGLREDGLFREEALATPAGARSAAASLRADGADVIKNYWLNNAFESLAIDAAHAAGMPVTTHYLSLAALVRGLEGKEHANFYFLGDGWTTTWRQDALALSKAAGTCITPTVSNYLLLTRGRSPTMALDTALFQEEAVRRYTSPFGQWLWQQLFAPAAPATMALQNKRFAQSVDNVRRMREAGLRIGAGTDFGPAGWSLHAEMELLVQAGFTPAEAIRAATLDAAACAGLQQSLGSVEVGKIADLVLVEGNPARDIRDARRVSLIILGGQPISRDDLAEAWKPSSSQP